MAEQPLGNEPPNKRAKIDSFQSPDPTGKSLPVSSDAFSTSGVNLRAVGGDER
ncbi:hypothetical protein E2C01_052621 [Portunus trituberculatus]|uniref:Uncharacterized protein n=1 Tax=Portunus trituberculatus TaxID=210409 RepID=A0A5B7GPW3_PORTR|nr:hypothetical protein [Portunus trituberculatus]